MKKIVTILEDYKVCLQHEITDRAWSKYRLESPLVSKAIIKLFLEGTIDLRKEQSPYGIPFHFYSLTGTPTNAVNNTINYKLRLLREHSQLTDEIGRFGEKLVAGIVENNAYTEVETRKEKHGKIGLRRMDIDVFAKHPHNYYQNIEVKNRRQQVNVNDINRLVRKTAIARKLWNLPIESALVCPFIYGIALKKAKSNNIPVAITTTIYVPEKYSTFYKEYSRVLGSHYIEVANSENPPKHLTELIELYIIDHKYEK
jgi:hypothetical protein